MQCNIISDNEIVPVHKNERDIEGPSLIKSVKAYRPYIKSILDVGAHWSHTYYAPALQQISKDEKPELIYEAADILDDPQTRKLVDSYILGNFIETGKSLKRDYISCISSIEHAGLTSYKQANYKQEQIDLWTRLCEVSQKVLFASFPYGKDMLWEGEFANITDQQLSLFESIAKANGFHTIHIRFFYTLFYWDCPYTSVNRGFASMVPIDKSKGTQCVALIEATKV